MSKLNKEKHPYVYTFLVVLEKLVVVSVLATLIRIVLTIPVALTIGDVEIVNTVLKIISYSIVLIVYGYKHRKELPHFFECKNVLFGFLLGWSEFEIDAFNVLMNHAFTQNVWVALINGLSPGLLEEVLFRIIPISFVMKNKDRERYMVPVLVWTSLAFGLIHGINILAGADPFTTLLQVLYAMGAGFVFGAIYMRTGNFWILILLHTMTDFFAYLKEGSLVLTQTIDLLSAMILIGYAIIYFVNFFYIFRKEKRQEAIKAWKGMCEE